MKFAILLITCCFSIVCANAQPGCTDPQAINFLPSATQNDGSCIYPPTIYFPVEIAQLPANLPEASGLEFFGGQLWVHQDGGAGPVLHSLDTATAALLETVMLPGLENLDWEDLAEDADHLYIGDFGNNAGNRTNLRIYKINKNEFLAGSATAEVIAFSFSDQVDFTAAPNANNFDCEAFVVLGDSIHLFSKRWLDKTTHRYTLPITAGTYVAQLQDGFSLGFLTTAADISEDGTIALLGYDGTTSETSLLLLWDYPGTSVFGGNKRKISLGNALNMSQAEGLAFRTNTEGYICSEKISVLPPRLLRFNVRQWLENPSSATNLVEQEQFTISPNPFSEFLSIDYQGIGVGEGQYLLVGTDGRVLRNGILRSGYNTIATASLPAGAYFFWVKIEEGNMVSKVLKN
jgi:hypothetical protein